MSHRFQSGGYAIAISIACFVAGCSAGESASSQGGEEGSFDQTTGAIVAHFKRIPDDVRCLEIHTSDWRHAVVRRDVRPGEEVSIRIGPIMPGSLWFWGSAYSPTCTDLSQVEGGDFASQTWFAETATADITPGRATPVSLVFRRLGSAEISVDFSDPPFCDAGGIPCPPPSGDGGFVR